MFKFYNEYDISITPSPTIDETEILSPIEGYRCFGSGTNFTLALTGTPTKNMATFILWEATASGTVTIFGTVMPAKFNNQNILITATYDGAAWQVHFDVDATATGLIENADIAANAAIARTKIANGTADYVVINNGSGTLSSEAQLANTRGGTGKNMSADTGVVKVSSGTFSASTVVNADVSASAAIAYSKLATLNTGQIIVGNGGVPTAVTMSGDATVSSTGVVTVPNLMFEPGIGSGSLKDKRATTSSGAESMAIGIDAISTATTGMAIGNLSENTGIEGMAVGDGANNTGSPGAAIGSQASNIGTSGQAIGRGATNSGVSGQAIGEGANNRIVRSSNISGPIIIRKSDATTVLYAAVTGGTYQVNSGSEVIIMTDTFNAKTLGTQEITFPSGVRMFVNEVGFIATTANTVTGQPELSYGITGNNAALLASTATTGITTAGARDRQTTLVTNNGVTSLTVEVQVAAVATTLVGRCYFKGLIVENQ